MFNGPNQPLFNPHGKSSTLYLNAVQYCLKNANSRALCLAGEPGYYTVEFFRNHSTLTITRDPEAPYRRVVYDHPLTYRAKS